jgi:hypothetical protein
MPGQPTRLAVHGGGTRSSRITANAMGLLTGRGVFGKGTGDSPASLFAAGEQGAWYDPSDLTTLFQDSAGITPVTAVEQPVGLMLDKRLGGLNALGPELVTNGDFSSGTTGWTAVGLTIDVVGGELQMTRTGSSQYVYQTLTTVAGRRYSVTFNYRNGTTSSAVAVGSTVGGVDLFPVTTVNSVSTATYTLSFLATGVASTIFWGLNAVSSTAFIDNVSVKEVPGNHAYQSTSTSRPVLRARYNLLTYSEQFDNAAWDKLNSPTVVANVAVAPDGTTTADSIQAVTGGAFRYVRQTITVAANATVMASIYVKKESSETVFGGLGLDFQGGTRRIAYVGVDAVTGTANNLVGGSLTAIVSVVNAGNYWRINVTATDNGSNTSCSFLYYANLSNDNVNVSGSPAASSAKVVWGTQLIFTNSLLSNAYQRIAAATDYDTTGFLPYLAFDGVDDSLLTNRVDFSATDKMTVWAGVRKLSDAAAEILAELSADTNANAGSFYIIPNYNGSAAAANLAFISRGTAIPSVSQVAVSAAFASPVTLVATATGDIAGDLSALRVNGAASGTNGTGDEGAGNYGNYPLYIGRRNNATMPLNGNLYSLIIRGAQSNANQISATESWVAQKTGVAL